MENQAAADSAWNPYSCLLSPPSLALAPALVEVPIQPGHTKNRRCLQFTQNLSKGAIVFKERAYIEDGTLLGWHMKRAQSLYNDRQAWSLTENWLKQHTVDQISSFFDAQYAQGIVAPGSNNSLLWEHEKDYPILMRLSHSYNVDAALVYKLYDILATNNIVSMETIVQPNDHVLIPLPVRYGFFPLLSRANHACIPSAQLSILKCSLDMKNLLPTVQGPGEITVLTTRDVVAGEELTFDYVHATPLESKRQVLLDVFNFRCACSHCANQCSLMECKKRGASLLDCPCKRAWYCGRDHQRQDWLRHKNPVSGEHCELLQQPQ